MIKLLKQLFNKIWYWRRYRKLKHATKTMQKAVKKKQLNQRELKLEIIQEIRSYLGIGKDDVSNYIPYDYKTRVRTCAHIHEKYGKEMRRLNVSITRDLQLR